MSTPTLPPEADALAAAPGSVKGATSSLGKGGASCGSGVLPNGDATPSAAGDQSGAIMGLAADPAGELRGPCLRKVSGRAPEATTRSRAVLSRRTRCARAARRAWRDIASLCTVSSSSSSISSSSTSSTLDPSDPSAVRSEEAQPAVSEPVRWRVECDGGDDESAAEPASIAEPVPSDTPRLDAFPSPSLRMAARAAPPIQLDRPLVGDPPADGSIPPSPALEDRCKTGREGVEGGSAVRSSTACKSDIDAVAVADAETSRACTVRSSPGDVGELMAAWSGGGVEDAAINDAGELAAGRSVGLGRPTASGSSGSVSGALRRAGPPPIPCA